MKKLIIAILLLLCGSALAEEVYVRRYPTNTPVKVYNKLSVDSDFLKINQTTPQTVSNGAPNFSGGIDLTTSAADSPTLTFNCNDGTAYSSTEKLSSGIFYYTIPKYAYFTTGSYVTPNLGGLLIYEKTTVGSDGNGLSIYRDDSTDLDYMKLYIDGSRDFRWTGLADMIMGAQSYSAGTGYYTQVQGGTGGQAVVGDGGALNLYGGNAGGLGANPGDGGDVNIHGGTKKNAGADGSVVITGTVDFTGITGNIDFGTNNLTTSGTIYAPRYEGNSSVAGDTIIYANNNGADAALCLQAVSDYIAYGAALSTYSYNHEFTGTMYGNTSLTIPLIQSSISSGLTINTLNGNALDITSNAGLVNIGNGADYVNILPSYTGIGGATSVVYPVEIIGETQISNTLHLGVSGGAWGAVVNDDGYIGYGGVNTGGYSHEFTGSVYSNTSITAPVLFATGAGGITLGTDVAAPTVNIPGYIKMFSAGNNAYYSTFIAGTQTANATYTLPTAMPTANSQALLSTTAGVMSWGTDFGTNDVYLTSLKSNTNMTFTIDADNNGGNFFYWKSGLGATIMTLKETGVLSLASVTCGSVDNVASTLEIGIGCDYLTLGGTLSAAIWKIEVYSDMGFIGTRLHMSGATSGLVGGSSGEEELCIQSSDLTGGKLGTVYLGSGYYNSAEADSGGADVLIGCGGGTNLGGDVTIGRGGTTEGGGGNVYLGACPSGVGNPGNTWIYGNANIDSDTLGLQLGDDQDMLLYSNAAGALFIKPTAANTDLTVNYYGTTNSGIEKWMEDEAYWTRDHVTRTATSLYRRYYHLPMNGFNPGSSGATFTAPSANHVGGWRLDAASEILYFDTDVHSDWDGASDLEVEVYFAVNVNNAGGLVTDTVDLKLICYYNTSGDTATKTQTVEVATVVGQSAQYKVFKASFTIDYDAAGNVVEAGDIMGFALNLETDSSEVDDIIVLHGSYNYNTTHMGVESSDT